MSVHEPSRPLEAVVLFARAEEHSGKQWGLAARTERQISRTLLLQSLATADMARGDADLVVVTDGPIDVDLPVEAQVLAQRGQGFEARLLAGIEDVCARGYRRLIVVGADIPSLAVSDIERARGTAGQLCVGPATDGGAYLFAFDASDRDRLEGLPWQRQSLLEALVAAFGDQELVTLPRRGDVDTADDIRACREVLRRLCRVWLGACLDLSKTARPLLRRHDARKTKRTGAEPTRGRAPPRPLAA